jgi:hypothetical protein
MAGPRYLHQCRSGELHADRLALTAVNGAVAKVPSGHARNCRPFEAVRARHVTEDEGCDDQVATDDAGDVASDVFHDTDELVSDRPDRMIGLAPVYQRSDPHTHASTTRTTASVCASMTRVRSFADSDVLR